jgi:hypothetical protein
MVLGAASSTSASRAFVTVIAVLHDCLYCTSAAANTVLIPIRGQLAFCMRQGSAPRLTGAAPHAPALDFIVANRLSEFARVNGGKESGRRCSRKGISKKVMESQAFLRQAIGPANDQPEPVPAADTPRNWGWTPGNRSHMLYWGMVARNLPIRPMGAGRCILFTW